MLLVQAKFDKLLEKHEARETGICPIREALYSQCFDELIRQETVFAAERYEHRSFFAKPTSFANLRLTGCGVRARRGALFLRVRDELRMTLDSLQVAYQSSLAYGVRHALECEQARGQMAEQIRALCAPQHPLFAACAACSPCAACSRASGAFSPSFVLCYPQFMICIF